ncbi:MAG: type 1 glutamine amidotransferase [Methylacidiphilales bacterium]|nr:type 1 glutamine amidotransferase [Candidatus Methylacidiphilales bacterium]
MDVAILQHAIYEGPGEIAEWAKLRGHAVATHHLYRGDSLPALADFDCLVVMGGEMNIYQYRDWPWLRPESALIRSALGQGKRAIGICLGAQFIADVMGSRVFQNGEIELGWLPIAWTPESRAMFSELPSSSTVLHWHGDTFGLPAGATRLALSAGCPEQGFVIPGQCLGLQFHLEVDPVLVKEFVQGQSEWPKGQYVQTAETILKEAAQHCDRNRQLLHGLLDRFVES